MSDELKDCPFCGEFPELPECHGTFYEFDCDCGMSGSSVQISDLMTIEERRSCPELCRENEFRYPDEYIKRAEKHCIAAWNTRTNPITHEVLEGMKHHGEHMSTEQFERNSVLTELQEKLNGK